jgi:LysM repeat protein
MNISKSDEIKGEDGRNLSGINETVNKDNWNNTIEPKQNDSIYVVKKNDTLFRVYRITGVTVQKLKELNKLTSNRISEGQLLRLN